MKLRDALGRREHSKKGKRFFTQGDMAEIKHQEAIKASQIKRGERKDKGNNTIIECGCGAEGCFIHYEFDSDYLQKKFPFLIEVSKIIWEDDFDIAECIKNSKLNEKKLLSLEDFLKEKIEHFRKWKGVPYPEDNLLYRDMLNYYPEAKILQTYINNND